MKIVAAVLILMGCIALAIVAAPVRVAEVSYTRDFARVTLKYPQILRPSIAGNQASGLVVGNSFKIALPKGDTYELKDSLRDTPLLCGTENCVIKNKIRIELAKVETEIRESMSAIDREKTLLVADQSKLTQAEERFTVGGCEQILLAHPPARSPLACSPDEQDVVANSLCLIKSFGPDACVKLSGADNQIFSSIAANEMCSTVVSALFNEQRTDSDRLVDAFMQAGSGLADKVFEDVKNGDWWKIIFVPHAIAIKAADFQRKAQVFDVCIPSAKSTCASAYAQWQSEYASFSAKFDEPQKQCTAQGLDTEALRGAVQNRTGYINGLDVALDSARKELAALEVATEVTYYQ